MNNFIKVRGLCAPSSFCVYKIVFDFFAEIQYYVSRIVCLEWEDIFGFSQEEIDEYQEIIESTAHLIMQFSQEGGFDNAAGF